MSPEDKKRLEEFRAQEARLLEELRGVRKGIHEINEAERLRRLNADPPPNYIVCGQFGHGPGIPCDTEEEVYKAIGSLEFGEGRTVESPVGLDTSQWIPY